ncbi:MAG TPA: GyrI-like domain-containing protein [Terriglobales bacterium]|nr:GyrI-like domain-containing protein [Terriglobales bacterium]
MDVARRLAINDQRLIKEQDIRTIEISGFSVIGIEARTDNAKEATAEGIIGRQWHRFIAAGMAERIPDKAGQNLYAVYSDYASDHNGEYTFTVGAQAKAGTTAPAGMVLREVRAAKYAVMTTEKGPFPKVIPEAWQRIFKLEDEGKLKRTYQTDFELYDERALDPQNGQVDIYIGVK